MEKSTEHLVIGRNKLKVGNLVRIETHSSFKSGSLLRTVVGTVKSVEEHDDKLYVVIVDALDDFTHESRERVKQKVTFTWLLGYDHAYYYLDKDSDSVSYKYKSVIKNANSASLKYLATQIKKEHLSDIKEFEKEIKKLQKELNEFKKELRNSGQLVKKFEQTYGV